MKRGAADMQPERQTRSVAGRERYGLAPSEAYLTESGKKPPRLRHHATHELAPRQRQQHLLASGKAADLLGVANSRYPQQADHRGCTAGAASRILPSGSL
jgi:hypothetical protein